MFTTFIILASISAVLLILAVLIQNPKGGGIAANFSAANQIAGVKKTNEFIEKAIKKHGDKYDYSKVDYKKSNTKVIIICKIHGDFEQTPGCHLAGSGCQKCYYKTISQRFLQTKDEFIKKSRFNKRNKSPDQFNNITFTN